MQNRVQLFNLGRLDYKKCLNVQKYLVSERLNNANGSDSLILVEHDPTYTIGIRRNGYKSAELDKLRSLNATVEVTDRGGLITFHGPGQLVAYPILNLKKYNASIKWYVKQLEQVIIDLCRKNFSLEAYRLCSVGYTGVWSNDRKIAAIGVHCKRYVTYHGVALNCNVDLTWFNHIVPCGIEDKRVSSLSELLKRELSVPVITPLFQEAFANTFNVQLELANSQDVQNLIEKSQPKS